MIFQNCQVFNEDDSPVGKCGRNMKTFFQKRWTELTGNWRRSKSGRCLMSVSWPKLPLSQADLWSPPNYWNIFGFKNQNSFCCFVFFAVLCITWIFSFLRKIPNFAEVAKYECDGLNLCFLDKFTLQRDQYKSNISDIKQNKLLILTLLFVQTILLFVCDI